MFFLHSTEFNLGKLFDKFTCWKLFTVSCKLKFIELKEMFVSRESLSSLPCFLNLNLNQGTLHLLVFLLHSLLPKFVVNFKKNEVVISRQFKRTTKSYKISLYYNALPVNEWKLNFLSTWHIQVTKQKQIKRSYFDISFFWDFL